MIKAVIIEDENHCLERIEYLLKKHHDSVQVLGIADSVDSGFILIKQAKPDLVFLDIQLYDRKSFELLVKFEKIDFELIFTTAYNQYAVEAFQLSAVDYLLKPLDTELFDQSLKKVKNRLQISTLNLPINSLLANFKQTELLQKTIIISSQKSIDILRLQEVIRCESAGSNCSITSNDGKCIISSKSIKFYEEVLPKQYFFRTHQSHLVQRQYVKRVHTSDRLEAKLSNNDLVPISVRKKSEFISWLGEGNDSYL
ncbi:MAG: LytR/AlgR family response regulator transcription factor [Flavobacteriales bacterium]